MKAVRLAVVGHPVAAAVASAEGHLAVVGQEGDGDIVTISVSRLPILAFTLYGLYYAFQIFIERQQLRKNLIIFA